MHMFSNESKREREREREREMYIEKINDKKVNSWVNKSKYGIWYGSQNTSSTRSNSLCVIF